MLPESKASIPTIDTSFNVESDANGRDPDQYSPTLRRYHQLLWSKPLPDGRPFRLDTDGQWTYLRYESTAGWLYLSSDGIVHSYRNAYANRVGTVMSAVDPTLVVKVYSAACTVGAYTLFPGEVRDRKPTINGARGIHPRIADRFDLTLECIRRHYEGADSPLASALDRYTDFFALFGSFQGYVEFFLFQDLLSDDGRVTFYLPFDNFERPALPQCVEEYEEYAAAVLKFLHGRNAQVRSWAEAHLS